MSSATQSQQAFIIKTYYGATQPVFRSASTQIKNEKHKIHKNMKSLWW